MAKSSYERYIMSVVNNIRCNGKTRKKIKEDLLSHIQVKSQETGENDPWKLLGEPHEVAKEFAMCAYAQANVAIGDTVKGILGVYHTEGTGDVLLKTPVDKEVFVNEVRKIYPKISGIILRMLKIFVR